MSVDLFDTLEIIGEYPLPYLNFTRNIQKNLVEL